METHFHMKGYAPRHRFQKEVQGNSEMAYYRQKLYRLIGLLTLCTKNLPILPDDSARAKWLILLKKKLTLLDSVRRHFMMRPY